MKSAFSLTLLSLSKETERERERRIGFNSMKFRGNGERRRDTYVHAYFFRNGI